METQNPFSKEKSNTETLLDKAVEAKALRMEYEEHIKGVGGVLGELLQKQLAGKTTASQDVLVNIMATNYRYAEDLKSSKKEIYKKLKKPQKPEYNYPGGVPPLEVRKGLEDGSASDEEKKKAQEDYDAFMSYARGMVAYKRAIILQRRMIQNDQDLQRRKANNRKKNKVARKARKKNRK